MRGFLILLVVFLGLTMPVMAQAEATKQQSVLPQVHTWNTEIQSDESGHLWQGFWVEVINDSNKPIRGISIQARQLLISEGFSWSGIVGEVFQNGNWLAEAEEIALAGGPGYAMVLFPDTIPGLVYDWAGYTITTTTNRPKAKPEVETREGDDFLWAPGAWIGTIGPRTTVTVYCVFREYEPPIVW